MQGRKQGGGERRFSARGTSLAQVEISVCSLVALAEKKGPLRIGVWEVCRSDGVCQGISFLRYCRARRADRPEPRGVSEAVIVHWRAGCVWIESILFGLAKD